jgi:outer membrane protein TolC
LYSKGLFIVKTIILIMTLFLAVSVQSVRAEQTSRTLSLNEAITLAVEKNLDLRAEFYNPAQFEADINRNRAIYDPLLTAETSYADNAANPSFGSSASAQTFTMNSGISQLFWSGGSAALSFTNSYNTNDATQLQHYWQSGLGISLSQPLLKNRGREVTEANIRISQISKYASLERLTTQLQSTVAQVRNQYFTLYSLREALAVKKVSLELARTLLKETKARVNAGVLPAMEILNAEFGAVSREKELIDAEKAVNDQLDLLRLLLQIDPQVDLQITDSPVREPYQVVDEDAIKRAFTRPDLREQRRNLELNELQTRVFNNKLKPDLSLNASASLNAVDPGYPRNLEKIGTFDNPGWSIGLIFSYPLGNNAAENDYRKSRLKVNQTALQIQSLEQNVANGVRAALRTISSGYKQIEVSDRGVAFAEERLRAFVRKNQVGLATMKDVLDVENDLVAAKNNQISALVSYNNAITALWLSTGELLERQGIRLDESEVDRLSTTSLRDVKR